MQRQHSPGVMSVKRHFLAQNVKKKNVNKKCFHSKNILRMKMYSLCRLCAKCMEASNVSAEISELESKLKLCCGWKPLANEIEMPQSACYSCVEQLQKSWTFAESVWLAEEQLIKLGNEVNQQHVNESITHIEEILTDSIKTEPDIVSFELDELEHTFDDTAFEDPIIQSDAENSHARKSIRKRKKSSKKAVVKDNLNTDSFIAALSDDECVSGGTISEHGVAKLEKLFPEMKSMTWNDCQYKCIKCNRIFKSPQCFVAHNRSMHLGEVQSLQICCFYCDFKHNKEFNLNKHIADKHFPHLKYRCLYCTDYFWDVKELIKHRNMHTDIQYKCEICDQIFWNRDILYTHVSQSHLKKKWGDPESKFTCDICNKDFATKWSIKSHMLQHTKKFDYVCDQCGWKFLTKGNLKGHLETTHTDEKPFSCTKCDSRFKTKHQLTNHSKRHDDIKPWVCTVCSKRFRVMYNLTVHMRSHNNIKPYTCKYCDRKFRHTSSLKTHERTHTSEKPYICGHCEYRSTNWPNLNKHSLRIHSIDLRTKKT